jgi:Transposase DDE domain
MARARKLPIQAEQVRGRKYLRRIASLLQRLHDDATARDKAHNRTLFFDQYAALLLVMMFSPAIDSLRAIRQASAMPKVRKLLGCPSRVSLGSLSEAARVFDPNLLLEVIEELSRELAPLVKDPRLTDIQKTLTLCDGTLLAALPRLAESMWKHSRTGKVMHGWRMHTQFELDRHVPTDVQLTPYRCQGDEPAVLANNLQSGRCYVIDRGYFNYTLFNGIVDASSDYVCRVKKSIDYQVTQELALSSEARAAGVVRDVIVTAGCGGDRRANHPVRLVEVHAQVQPRAARGEGKPQAPPKPEVLLIATNLLDVPAELIALIYRYRWTVELFFRFFKQILGCRHLISDDPGGITIQCYCAVIACMLLQLWTGKKPNKDMHRMISFYLCGWADEADVLAWANQPDNTGVKLRAKEALWKKLGW